MSEVVWPRALIFSMYHHHVDLFQVCSNYALGAILGPKMAPPWGHMFTTQAYIRRSMKKNFSSETTRPRGLIFGITHQLVNLHQVCSNYNPGTKNGLPWVSHVLHRLI